jgi:hypothetical protein
MNTELNKLLVELAVKLGTTVEYLRKVLIKQALISGTCDLLACGGWIVLCIWLYKLIQRKTSGDDPEWGDEGTALAWIIWGIFVLGSAIIIGYNLGTILASLLNPEYWALKQIIH